MPGSRTFFSFLLSSVVWLVSMAPAAAAAVSTNDNTRPAGRIDRLASS